MNKKVPRSVVILAVMTALIAALWVVGIYTPTKKGTPPGGGPMLAAPDSSPLANKPAPEVTGKTVTGEAFQLSKYQGKVVLLNFWATWCGPCRTEIPDLVALQKEYGPKGFTVIGLATSDDPKAVASYIKENPLGYPVVLTPDGVQEAYGGVTALPTSFLIDQKGTVVTVIVGMTDKNTLEPQIQKLLAKE